MTKGKNKQLYGGLKSYIGNGPELSDVLIAGMIKHRVGTHKVLLPINQNVDKIQERN